MPSITFQTDYHTQWGEQLCVDYTSAEGKGRFALSTTDGHTWTGTLITAGTGTYTYVYKVYAGEDLVRTEEGLPHSLSVTEDMRTIDAWGEHPGRPAPPSIHIAGFIGRRDDNLPWRVAGVVVPVFSLRSKSSWGVGDFGDLALMVRWTASVGMHVVQLLPINDTTFSLTWRDSYPYNATSVFALHPIYLNPGEWTDSEAFLRHNNRGRELNEEKVVDYEACIRLKLSFLSSLYAEIGSKVEGTDDYKTFVANNDEWLPAYASFFSGKTADTAPAAFIQYLLHKQLSAVATKAKTLGVILKGDIPIGVNPKGVDARQHPDLFHFEGSAGAPPDYFATEGQNWGFPTYCWEKMSQDNYAWWKARLRHMSRYFSAYRIDHVLGFFRIWEIPVTSRSGLLGHFRPALPYSEKEIREAGFLLPMAEACTPAEDDEREVLFIEDPEQKGCYHPRIEGCRTHRFASLPEGEKEAYCRLYNHFFFHRHNDFWAKRAHEKLKAVCGATGMLACAEDLGMVPESVPSVLSSLRILSLEIQTMPKESHTRFANPAAYPYLSVATFSTHDMPPLRLWWRQDLHRSACFYAHWLGLSGSVPPEAPPEVCQMVVRQHLEAPSMLCLLSLQDWLSMSATLRRKNPEEEQINVPANPDQYWQYRMHLNIEDLALQTPFNEQIRSLISLAGR